MYICIYNIQMLNSDWMKVLCIMRSNSVYKYCYVASKLT